MSEHPRELLPAYADGTITDADRAAVDAHVRNCTSCSHVVSAARRVLDSFDDPLAAIDALDDSLVSSLLMQPRHRWETIVRSDARFHDIAIARELLNRANDAFYADKETGLSLARCARTVADVTGDDRVRFAAAIDCAIFFADLSRFERAARELDIASSAVTDDASRARFLHVRAYVATRPRNLRAIEVANADADIRAAESIYSDVGELTRVRDCRILRAALYLATNPAGAVALLVELDRENTDSPLVHAAIAANLACAYERTAQPDLAIEAARRSLRACEQLPEHHISTRARANVAMASALLSAGRGDEAAPLFDYAAALLRQAKSLETALAAELSAVRALTIAGSGDEIAPRLRRIIEESRELDARGGRTSELTREALEYLAFHAADGTLHADMVSFVMSYVDGVLHGDGSRFTPPLSLLPM